MSRRNGETPQGTNRLKEKKENERKKREEAYKENERKDKVDHERKYQLKGVAQFTAIQERKHKLRVEIERKRVEDVEERQTYENEKIKTELNVRVKREEGHLRERSETRS